MEILEVLEAEVEVEILVDTVAEVEVKKLGNTAGDVETEAEQLSRCTMTSLQVE